MFARYFLAACLGCGAISVSQAQEVEFACPKSGTIEERGFVSLRYTGTSPTDPYVCAQLDPWSNPQFLLFNYYILTSNAGVNSSVRAGMLELLSGRKKSVSFAYMSPTGSVSQHTWSFFRKEEYTVGGRKFDAIVFGHEILGDPRNLASTPFHGYYTEWLDCKTGVWLKSDLIVTDGQVNHYPRPYQDRLITEPEE